MRPLLYLAVPYSSSLPTPEERAAEVAERMRLTCEYMAKIENQGEYHAVTGVLNHFVSQYAPLPTDFAFWGSWSITMLARCDRVHVLKLPGWSQSIGVRAEVAAAVERRIPIDYIEPE